MALAPRSFGLATTLFLAGALSLSACNKEDESNAPGSAHEPAHDKTEAAIEDMLKRLAAGEDWTPEFIDSLIPRARETAGAES